MHFSRLINISVVIFLICTGLTGCKDKKQSAQPVKGRKKIITEPAGASIIYNGREIGVTPYTITAKPGKYTVKLEKNGYSSRYASFSIAPGMNKEEKFKIPQASSAVLIESIPSKAYVVYRGKRIGETPLVMPELSFGEYSVRLEKSGHAPKDAIFTVASERPHKVTVPLESNIGSITINSSPRGASVYLNGKNIGITPFTVEYPDGEYNISVRHPNYTSFESKIIIQKGKKIVKNYTLHLIPGEFEIVSNPAGAKVSVNGRYMGVTPLILKKQRANINHNITITSTGYETVKDTLKAAPGRREKKVYVLKRNLGDLELVINPPGVTVYIDGVKYAVTQKAENSKLSQVMTVKNLKPGDHIIRCTHRRGRPASKTKNVKIIAGETVRPAPMSLWIPNAEIIYNDDSSEQVVILSKNRDGVFVEPPNGIRYTILNSKIKTINYFKDSE